jgi:hypothetical protein
MSKRRNSQTVGELREEVERGNPLKWVAKIRREAEGLVLKFTPEGELSNAGAPISPFNLTTGRDFLNAIRSVVFELTRTAVTTQELAQWIEHLEIFDPAYARRVRRALATESTFLVAGTGCELPVCYSSRRIVILDARAYPAIANGYHYQLMDLGTGLDVGSAQWTRDGYYLGFVPYGPHDLECSGRTLGELASSCLMQMKWALTH